MKFRNSSQLPSMPDEWVSGGVRNPRCLWEHHAETSWPTLMLCSVSAWLTADYTPSDRLGILSLWPQHVVVTHTSYPSPLCWSQICNVTKKYVPHLEESFLGTDVYLAWTWVWPVSLGFMIWDLHHHFLLVHLVLSPRLGGTLKPT